MRMDGGDSGQFEHYVVTKVIPESVRTTWNEWRQSLRKEEKSQLGSNNISDSVEMAGWGVEQAQERNREEASESNPPLVPFPIWPSFTTWKCLRQLHVMREGRDNLFSPCGYHGQLPSPAVLYLETIKGERETNSPFPAGLATQLALAYAIHKSFIFLRVPLTAAVTPKVVKVLRGWGWDIGKRTPRS